MAACFMSSRPS